MAMGGSALLSKTDVFLMGVIAAVCYIISISVYRLFFHPLRKFPGPILNRISHLPIIFKTTQGTVPYHVHDLHQRYGPVVRIEPDKLCFIDSTAWKDVHSHRAAEHVTKDWSFYRRTEHDPRSLISEEGPVRTRLRRAIAMNFSDRAMRDQEPIVGTYVDLLLNRLAKHGKNGQNALNLRDWYTFTTFDVIGKLAFSSDFGCLSSSDYHPWVRLISFSFKYSVYMGLLKRVGLSPLYHLLFKIMVNSSAAKHRNMTKDMLDKRMEMGRQPDYIQSVADAKDTDMSPGKLHANALLFVVAGSETTATSLTAVTWLLLTNPKALERVIAEVRSSFEKPEDITLSSVSKLSYMLACLDEALRIFPAIPQGLPRRVIEGPGVEVCGHHVPGNTSIQVPMYAMFHSERNFTAPDEFHPERFLDEPRFANDYLEAVQPFTIGPYDCVGRTLAYAEMRLVLAGLLFGFDMRLAEDSVEWAKNQKAYSLWQKPPLNVYLTPVSR